MSDRAAARRRYADLSKAETPCCPRPATAGRTRTFARGIRLKGGYHGYDMFTDTNPGVMYLIEHFLAEYLVK